MTLSYNRKLQGPLRSYVGKFFDSYDEIEKENFWKLLTMLSTS